MLPNSLIVSTFVSEAVVRKDKLTFTAPESKLMVALSFLFMDDAV